MLSFIWMAVKCCFFLDWKRFSLILYALHRHCTKAQLKLNLNICEIGFGKNVEQYLHRIRTAAKLSNFCKCRCVGPNMERHQIYNNNKNKVCGFCCRSKWSAFSLVQRISKIHQASVDRNPLDSISGQNSGRIEHSERNKLFDSSFQIVQADNSFQNHIIYLFHSDFDVTQHIGGSQEFIRWKPLS